MSHRSKVIWLCVIIIIMHLLYKIASGIFSAIGDQESQ